MAAVLRILLRAGVLCALGLGSVVPLAAGAENKEAIASYDRMQPGAPHWAWFANAWQPFTAQSSRITRIGVTVGNRFLSSGATVPYNLKVRLCASQPDGNGNCGTPLAEANTPIVNYGNTYGSVGDVPVTPGRTYWAVWFQPAAHNGEGWVTFWWAGGSTIGTSDQMQMVVRGYNPDTSRPVASQFSYTPAEVDVSDAPREVTAGVRITDAGTGVEGALGVAFRGPGTAEASGVLSRVSGTAQDGQYRAVVTVPQDAAPGDWVPSLHAIRDGAGNLTPAAPAPGSPEPLKVISIDPDVAGPVITEFGIDPAVIDAGGVVRLRARVTDDTGTDGPAEMGFVGPDGRLVLFAARRESGTVTDAVYVADVTIPPDAVGGRWTARLAGFRDLAGNAGPATPPSGLSRELEVKAKPPPPPVSPPPPTFRYAIANVASVNLRAGPGTNFAIAGALPGRAPIDILCQTRGTSVNGSPIWDRLLAGTYVSDWYTTTPVVGDYSPGIPRCPGAPAAPPPPPGGRWHITATAAVNARRGPGASHPVAGSLAPGSRFDIACQTYGTYVLGSPVWDKLPDGRYVSDFYVSTPVFGSFSPGIPVCAGTGARPAPPSGGNPAPSPAPAPPGGGIGTGPTAPDCSRDVLFIGARGSGEGETGFGPQGAPVLAAFRAVQARLGGRLQWDSLDHGYPAMAVSLRAFTVDFWSYAQSVRSGISTMETSISTRTASWIRRGCKKPLQILLAGYSQGAWAAGNLIRYELPREDRDRVKGVLLLGDALRRGSEFSHGVAGRRHAPYADMAPKISSICRDWDPVCDYGPVTQAALAPCGLGLPACEHRKYTSSGQAAAGGHWLADRVRP